MNSPDTKRQTRRKAGTQSYGSKAAEAMTAGPPKAGATWIQRSPLPVARQPGFLIGGSELLRGIYAAASSMIAQTIKQDTIANNLANVSTPGYKRASVQFESFPGMTLVASDQPANPIGTVSFGSMASGTYIDMSHGTPHYTGNPLDVMIKGDGFFVVETPQGRAYTREGSFMVGPGKVLMTAKGHPVLGDLGRIVLEDGAVAIGRDGTITVNGTARGRLQVVTLSKPDALVRDANGYFLAGPDITVTPVSPEIESGALEWSNVNPVKEMVNLITVLRSYEASVKALVAQDDTLGKAVNELAK